jgi:hypothetical protein
MTLPLPTTPLADQQSPQFVYDPGGTSAGTEGGPTGSAGGVSEREQFFRIYRAVYYALGLKPNTKVMNRGFAQKLPGSSFLIMIRREDKRYVRTNEFLNRAVGYLKQWQLYFPQRKFEIGEMLKYVKGDWSSDRIDWYIRTRTKAFRELYPYANLNTDIVTYQKYQQALDRYTTDYYGRTSNDDEKQMWFKAGLTPSELEQRASQLVPLKETYQWMTGQAPKTAEFNQAMFGGENSQARRDKLIRAATLQKSIVGSTGATAGLVRDEKTQRATIRA